MPANSKPAAKVMPAGSKSDNKPIGVTLPHQVINPTAIRPTPTLIAPKPKGPKAKAPKPRAKSKPKLDTFKPKW